MRSSGSRGAVTSRRRPRPACRGSAPARAGRTPPTTRPAPPRRAASDGVRHRRCGGRAVAGGHRPGPVALQQSSGVLDIGHRRGSLDPAAASDDGGARITRIGTGLDEPVAQHRRQPRVGAERPGGDRLGVIGHGPGDVDVHVVPARQQQRDHDRGRPVPASSATTSTTVGGCTSTKAAVVARPGRSARAARASSAISRAAGGVAGAVRAGDQHRASSASHRSQRAEAAAVDGDHRAGHVRGSGEQIPN